MSKDLGGSLSHFVDTINGCTKSKKSILVTTHTDCDGLAAGGIMARALISAGAIFTVSAEREFDSNSILRLQKDSREFHIIVDLGGGFSDELDSALGDRWVVLDHHRPYGADLDNEKVINAWKFGFDGGSEICSGGISYLAARAMDEKNSDLAAMAVIAALGDGQDAGSERSLEGENLKIVRTAEGLGLMETDQDLLLTGRDTTPIPDSLAATTRPFVEGLTWNRDACIALLQSAGVPLKSGDKWRVPAELSEEEKRSIAEAVAKQISDETQASSYGLIGRRYVLSMEDKDLTDGREFAAMVDSCGRAGKTGAGVALCMGERGSILNECTSILADYKEIVKKEMGVLINERWRTMEDKFHIMVNGEGIVLEELAGTMASMIASSPKSAGKVVVLRTGGKKGSIRLSARKPPSCTNTINLGDLMRSGAAEVGGSGGGHDASAWARTTRNKLGRFLEYVSRNVADVQGTDHYK